MSASVAATRSIEPIPPFPVRRFTVDEYHRMIEAGVFSNDEQYELLKGWIVPKMTRNPPHDASLELVQEALRSLLPPGWRLRVQSAITMDDSEPEPDLAIVRGSIRSHAAQHPTAADVALVIEIAEASLAHDRIVKGPLYARAQIPVYWIVNLVDSRVEVYSQPSSEGENREYALQADYQPNEEVPFIIEGREIARISVRDLLP